MEELKKCPFCGAEATMENNGSGYYWVQCNETCCQMFAKYSEIEAIIAWNTRQVI